ncbi:MAG: aminodeoxychorismate lyase [Gammaproteobacteria bacterium]|nr:aminodeoxychorismate lyase [Gammaproteobacteria bacterium]
MTSVIINGQAETGIDYRDRGLQYGDGLFETIAYKHGRLIYWQEHLARLNAGCQRLNLPVIDESQWLADLQKLSITNNHHVIKLILTRGVGGRGYKYHAINTTRVIACYDWPDYPASNFNNGVEVRICDTGISVNPSLAGIKHLNRLDNVLARNEWSGDVIAEGLMLDDMAYVIEGTMSNVFGVKDEVLYTPDLSRAGVTGIVRNKVITIAKDQGMVVYETNITRQQLLEMDAVFLTNSLFGVWPVKKLENINYKNNFIVKKLAEQLRRIETGNDL